MKVYSAKYDAQHNTADNSLVANLLKYPEIAKKVIELYPRYTTTYLLEKLGFGASEKVLGDNSFEWKSMGRYRQQQTLQADYTEGSAVTVGDSVTITIHDTDAKVCMINANDIIRLANGARLHVTSLASGTNLQTLTCVALDGYAAGTVSANSIVGVIGNAFVEGSEGGSVGEGYAYPETRKNYVTISRKKLVIDARDLTDVTWVEHNGHRVWFFTKEQQTDAQFMYDLEVMRWFGKASFSGDISTPGGAQSSAVAGVPTMGDGILEQIKGANTLTYGSSGDDAELTEDMLLEFIGNLSLNSQSPTGNEWVVFGGTQAKIQWHKAMKDLLVTSGAGAASVFVDKAGQDVAVGSNFSTYYALGNKITFAHCPVFDDPNLATAPGYANNAEVGTAFKGAGSLSGLMVFLDMGTSNGVANIELISKGAEGTNRNWVKKYVPGMINPYDPKSMLAASGDDKFECHWLTQSGIIVRNPLTCGILKPVDVVI
jgi:hypothetical protein